MNQAITAPVLFLCFNRPEKTRQVFDCIRRAKPLKLYVAIDAPRDGRQDDIENCNKVKEIVHNVDWPCEAKYLEREKNLGCTLSGKTAWDWLFSQEEEMIFLEDDGLVTDSFFWYCQELLDKYRNDDRIAYIGAVNFGQKYGDASYFFTRYSVSTYAMATWKRVYDLYDYDLDSYPEVRNSKDFKSKFLNKLEYDMTCSTYDNYYNNLHKKGVRGNTYDLQMTYLVRRYGKLCIYPNLNQVTNIGFDYGGSNTSMDPNSEWAKVHTRPRFEFDAIRHPETVSTDEEFEKLIFKQRVLNGTPICRAFTRFYLIKYLRPIKRMIFK